MSTDKSMTIVYYTSNADHQHLEDSVREMIVRNSCGLPIISVSHRPIDFGHNIVIGDIGRSTENIFMQLQIGAEHAKTKYIAVCEADALVPEKFFAFRPQHEKMYCWPEEGYITWTNQTHKYYPMILDDLVGVVGREHLLLILEYLRARAAKGVKKKRRIRSAIRRFGETEFCDFDPVVHLKTRRQMHRTHPFDVKNPVFEIPVWGSAKEVWKQYGGVK
jgi:hypothetical protein